MKLQDKIVMLRKKKGWSQEEFAEKMYVSRQTTSRWENGTALPDAQNVLQLSKLFDVTTDYLLNDDYESDGDIPIVQKARQETDDVISKNVAPDSCDRICDSIILLVGRYGNQCKRHTDESILLITVYLFRKCSCTVCFIS